MAISKNLFAVSADNPPVMEVRRWLDDIPRTTGLPLLNMSQAAPMSLPPKPLREAVARSLMEETEAHVYGPVLGLPELRAEVAKQWSAAYGGEISAEQVGITSGCNQAFAAVASALSRTGGRLHSRRALVFQQQGLAGHLRDQDSSSRSRGRPLAERRGGRGADFAGGESDFLDHAEQSMRRRVSVQHCSRVLRTCEKRRHRAHSGRNLSGFRLAGQARRMTCSKMRAGPKRSFICIRSRRRTGSPDTGRGRS